MDASQPVEEGPVSVTRYRHRGFVGRHLMIVADTMKESRYDHNRTEQARLSRVHAAAAWSRAIMVTVVNITAAMMAGTRLTLFTIKTRRQPANGSGLFTRETTLLRDIVAMLLGIVVGRRRDSDINGNANVVSSSIIFTRCYIGAHCRCALCARDRMMRVSISTLSTYYW